VLTGIGKAEGQILFNDAPRPKDFVAMCAVIPQEDTLYGALTPRETFTYVARLRLGDDVPLAKKIEAAEEMIVRLELTKCADTPVGNEDIRGISGGEKKRTSIGCELIVNPVVLFVDEPTSGLDSKMARSVIEHLKTLAQVEHRTVITVIHQPSWRIFSLFDALVLLKDGRVVYDGPAAKVQV
jgi:ATP-binding cassette, subfamily G (WHITE), member 2